MNTLQNSTSIQRIQPMGGQSTTNSWLENRVFVHRYDRDAFFMITDSTAETDGVQAEIEGILSSNKSISAMDIYAELAKKGFDDRAIYNWSQTEELANPHENPILYAIACQFRDEAFVKEVKNFNHGTSGLHIGGDVHLNSNSMNSIPSHGSSTQVNSKPATNLYNSGSANHQINSEPTPVRSGFENYWISKIREFVSSADMPEVSLPVMDGLEDLIDQVKIDYHNKDKNNNGEISNERLFQLFQDGGLGKDFAHYFR